LQKALDYWYVKALDMFGRAGSKRSERYRYWGLKRRSNEQARKEYIAEVNPLILKLGLQVPEVQQGKRLYH
jgi:1,2-phenylacetyl-CoA epoxidase catalytic subunit